MRIVYFIDHLRPDGTQFVLKQLVEGFGSRGHHQVVICLNDSWDDVVLRKIREAAADVHIVGKLALVSGVGLVSIFRWLRKGRFDVAVTLLFASDVIGRSLAKLASVPRIVTSIQTRDEFYTQLQRWLVRRTMPWADVVELCSIHLRDFVITEEGAKPDQICVIPHSVRAENYMLPVDRVAVRSEFGLKPDDLVIGSVGRLTSQKGFDVLLQAIALLPPDIHLLLLGIGEEEESLKTLAADLDLSQRLHFVGYRRDLPVLLGAIDLYVQPSRFEGMSIAVLAAMASGCPIVATAVDGTRDQIKDGVHGWLVPPENPAALAQAIQNAISDSSEAEARGQAARKRVIDRFNQGDMITAWENMMMDCGQIDG